ncbi:hypothetical protein [Variovorax arabinosiphilus]|uniref:hypothetical protein n=1 Tax=Variovorax arabinosiphilus TaxID=3053498 RepID=UPI002577771D|nr:MULTISPECIES: hypothetical protein [unclassified Variovorax]MDM0118861.1 hypothetical protein [Variovorax sp. J2L1-78]MDM0129286.1 hypothetical protein [Variovorax sp. J2L1-63]MDM0232927.1 hypothetical protein [Variovorax sp. J2R1-6]
MEWLLVLTLHLTGPKGNIRDIAPTVISGFTSEAMCKGAAEKVAESLIRVTGAAKERQGLAKNSMETIPAVNFECIAVRK